MVGLLFLIWELNSDSLRDFRVKVYSEGLCIGRWSEEN